MNKILIVEDEEAIANLIRMNLSKAGYQCEIATDGEAAADRIGEQNYDLILLDIMLPKLNGYEVLEYAKTVDIPVIFLTALEERRLTGEENWGFSQDAFRILSALLRMIRGWSVRMRLQSRLKDM